MRIRSYVRPLLFAMLLAASVSALGQGFYIKPHVQNITPDGATIIWETPDASLGTVTYGLEGAVDKEAKETATAKIHKVRIAGLQPETAYTYLVREGTEEFTSAFKTGPGTQREIVFVVIGDSRRWGSRFGETDMAKHIHQWEPEFIINMGDLVGSGHKYEQWPEHFQRFSDFNHRLMMVTARGNHEGSRTRDAENDWYGKYHDMPGEGEPFSAFDWGNSHFVLISYEETRKAAPWLDNHLANVDKPYVFVAQHYPVYCAGYYSPTDSRKETGRNFAALAEVFDKHDVSVDLAGHTHIYERILPLRAGQRDDQNGTTYVVQGGDIGGSYPETWTAVKDDHRTMDEPTYTVFVCKQDRVESRTFCWSTIENRIIEIDYFILWEEETVPRTVLDSLPNMEGDALSRQIEQLGAMMYEPSAQALLPYLDSPDEGIRWAAAKAVRSIGATSSMEALLPYVNDPDVIVAREAARALEIAMPEKLAKDMAKVLGDPNLDDDVATALMGALALRGPEKVAYEAAMELLGRDGPGEARRRAAYALMGVASKKKARDIARQFENEPDQWAMVRLAYTLNELTGRRQNLSDKGPLYNSEPGQRQPFVDKWLKR